MMDGSLHTGIIQIFFDVLDALFRVGQFVQEHLQPVSVA
jgi:hypothetical protein